jgi:hypothetical protein
VIEPFDPLAAALRLAAELEARSIAYAIGGALALSLWSEPRATNDVDVNVFVEPDGLAPVFAAIAAAGALVDPVQATRDAVARGMFIARWPSGHPLDVFTPSIDFSYEAARTRVRRQVASAEAWFLSAEGIAIFKLYFFRGKDRVDVERLVQLGAYIREEEGDLLLRRRGTQRARAASSASRRRRRAVRVRPWTLRSMLVANSLRMVPGSAFSGLVAPMTARFLATASSPSSTCTTTGPSVMNLTRSL